MTKKRSSDFWSGKVHPAEKILATPMIIIAVINVLLRFTDVLLCFLFQLSSGLDVFTRRGIRAGFCNKNDKNMSAVSDLVEEADDALFERVMRDKHHVLYHLFF